jgi:hypothetical protein
MFSRRSVYRDRLIDEKRRITIGSRYFNTDWLELRCRGNLVHHGAGNGVLAPEFRFQSLTADQYGLKVGGEALMVVTPPSMATEPARYLILL